jgi:cell division protein FtsW
LTGLRANLFFVSLGLSLLGVVMVYSATYREVGPHYLLPRAGHVVLGVGAFFVASRVRYTAWRRYAPVLYLVVLCGLILVLVPGIGAEVGGSRRWLDLGPVSLQPGEFAKLAAIVGLSCAVARVPPGSGLPLRPLAAVGVLFGLVVVEPDFGTSVVLLAGAAGVLWASELRTRDLVLSAAAAFVALIGVMMLAPYRRERFMTFLDPWAVADGSGYQVVQSMVAIKAGGFFGSGAGAGSRGAAVPELGTDMIFALIGEELGLLGMVVVIAAFGFLTLAGFRISLRAPTVLGRCLAAGLTTMLAVQAIFNMGAAMVVLPLTGMTLPFISYGGSSLMVCFAAVGIL